MNIYIKTFLSAFLCVILPSFVFTGCSDELNAPGNIIEGEAATVKLQIDLDEISVKSRSDMSSDLENRVECLWVAIYNVNSGKRTFSKFYAPDGDFPEIEKKYGVIDDIKTESGESYIVAVANYENKIAVDLVSNKDTEQDLEALLQGADTWDKYRSIAIKQKFDGENIHVETPAEAIVMQGSYRAQKHSDTYSEDEDGAEKVGIQPGANNLTGKIHLRRIWTQNKFTIKPSGNLVSMELVDVEVINVPVLSWLYGRKQDASAGTLGYANAGDAYSPDMTNSLKHDMYRQSLTYTPTSMTVTTDDKGRPNYSFDYWQYENKRNGAYASSYEDREREHKKADGTNSGIYTSLCGNSGKATLDNNATFIRFTAKIRYLVDENGVIQNPAEIDEKIGTVRHRNAEVTYVVHLGYIGKDPKDFNCYRNSKYIYNITVESVNKVLLEAFKLGENQPGVEGAVTDVTEGFYDLDAHFNVFNIYLEKSELEKFTFTMTTYEDNVPHTITNITDADLGLIANVPDKDDKANWKYYNWIQLVTNGKTDEKTKIAKFPNLTKGETPLYLNDLQAKAKELKDGEGYCFTVYLKEYTYEADYGDVGYGDERTTEWTHYVNQPSRNANFNVAYSVSDDRESQHFKAKYALSQRSIQTYYDIAKAASGHGTALGVEHTNEVFGMNMRWTNGDISGGFDSDNGRYNVWIALGGTVDKTTAGDGSWTKAYVLDLDNLLQVNKSSNTSQTAYASHLDFSGGTRFVPAMKLITSGLSGSEGGYNSLATSYDPQTGTSNAQYIQAIFSCMNRNKDENGDGKIDAEELKWYVPTSGKYLRVILGRNNLVTPLMSYEQRSLPQGCGDGFNTMYHYVTSDRKIVWIEEGMSSSNFNTSNKWTRAPWQVRCVRNLGTNLTTVSRGEKVTPAYDDTDVDGTTHGGVVKPIRYYGAALRNPTTLPLPLHKTSSPYNRLARYGFEIAPAGNGNTNNYDREAGMYYIAYNDAGTAVRSVTTIPSSYADIKNAVETASPCEKLNKSTGRSGWRLPNQKEIVIMLRAKVIRSDGTYDYTFSNNTLSASQNGWIVSGAGMMTCTQEHWPGIDDSQNVIGTAVDGTDALSARNRWTTIEPTSSLASAKQHRQIRGIRCVRDLTAEEANMTYTQIKNHKTD